MPALIFRRYYNIPKAMVEFSALEAGGFHPTFHNYHHGIINALSLIAFGGFILQLPVQEYEAAETFLSDLQTASSIADYDPIPERHFGKWKTGTVFACLSGFFLPFFFLPIWTQCLAYIGLALIVMVEWSASGILSIQIRNLPSFLVFVPLLAVTSIIFHAEQYVSRRTTIEIKNDPARPL